MATGEHDRTSDEIITVKCGVCDKKNTTREAEKYCVQCQDYYCVPCTDMHKMFPAMGGHQILDKADFRSHGLQPSDLPRVPTERCSVHKTKLLDMYCGNHDDVVCATCVALNHKSCKDIHSVPENVDKLYSQAAFDETKRKLNGTKKTLDDVKQAKEQLLGELKKSRDQAIDSIRKFRKEMEVTIEKLEKESIKKVEAEYAVIVEELQQEVTEAEKRADDLGQIANKLEKSTGNKAQEFVCIKGAKKCIHKFEESVNHLKRKRTTEIVFVTDTKISNFLQQVTTFGQVSSTTYKQKSTVYMIKSEKLINVKLTEDKCECVIMGSCFTSDGYLLLTDNTNKKIKRVAISTSSIKDYVDVDAGPRAVCQTSKDESAVSLENDTIQFVSLGDEMTTTRQLKLGHTCYGLACMDGKLFTSSNGNAVYIHDMTGTVINGIKNDRFGKAIFDRCIHICHGTSENRVYVVDQTKGLVILDRQGNYESTFSDPELKTSCGVCPDGRGILFWAGISSNILQICEKSKTKLGVLRNMMFSHSVCFDPHLNLLVVTLSDNDVRAYELE